MSHFLVSVEVSEERKIAEAAITTSTRLKNSLTSEKEARVTCEKVLKEKEVYKSFHLAVLFIDAVRHRYSFVKPGET